MLRIFVLTAATFVVLAGAALTFTTASAHSRGWHHNHGWHHHGWHHRYQWRGPRALYRDPVYGAYDPCAGKRWVPTAWGPQLRVTNVCH
ncbi:MAG TPA: sulfur globule protein precursor [Xanthobacteraceae bacterium]|nr:sulfur globule protein precursor [Xanthobacteraceae bacterium]